MTPATPAPGHPSRWRALLVGIERYRHAPALRGSRGDVERCRAFLRTAVGVPEAHIAVLLDEQATRDGIIDAFHRHLLEPGDLEPGDQVLIHFSGHGTQMRDPLDRAPSGYIEGLVAHDSGPGGAYPIPDRTVAALLRRLTARTPHVTVVLDCCHSGSGTRHHAPPRARLVEPDPRTPPPDLDAALIAAAALETAPPPDGGFTGRGLPYTLLAACRDRELAYEHVERTGDTETWGGLFSAHLYPALEAAPPGIGYAALMERVAARVTALAPHQHPQVEGRRDRAVFGGADVRRDPFTTVVEVIGGQLVLDAGALHGLTPGTAMALYPADVQTRDALPRHPLGTAEVTAVEPTRSRARLDPGGPAPEGLLHARALPASGGDEAAAGRVAFEVEPGAPPLPIQALGTRGPRLWRAVGADEPIDVRVVAGPRTVRLCDPSGQPLAASIERHDLPALSHALDTVARFSRLVRLHNPDPGSRLQGRLALRIRRHVEGEPDPGAMPVCAPVDGEVILPVGPDGVGARVGAEVVNAGDERIYPHVFLLGADYGVTPLHPVEAGVEAIDPGRSLFVGHTTPTERIEPWLPEHPWWPRARDLLLLIATTRPARLDVLHQAPLARAETRSLPAGAPRPNADPLADAVAAFAAGKRLLRRRVLEDWGTAHLPIVVLRRPGPVPVGPGPRRLPIGLTVDAAADSRTTLVAAELERMRHFHPVPAPPLAALRAAGLLPIAAPIEGPAGDSPLVLRFEPAADAPPRVALTLALPVDHPLVPVAFDAGGFRVLAAPGAPGRARLDAPPAGWVLLARPT